MRAAPECFCPPTNTRVPDGQVNQMDDDGNGKVNIAELEVRRAWGLMPGRIAVAGTAPPSLLVHLAWSGCMVVRGENGVRGA